MLPPPTEMQSVSDYVLQRQQRLEEAHEALWEAQIETRQADQEEPLLFAPGDCVWLINRRRQRRANAKLQAKFVGSYQVITTWRNHTYVEERQGQTSNQHESRLKPYHASPENSGHAPATLEPRRGLNKKKAKIARPLQKSCLQPNEELRKFSSQMNLANKLDKMRKATLQTNAEKENLHEGSNSGPHAALPQSEVGEKINPSPLESPGELATDLDCGHLAMFPQAVENPITATEDLNHRSSRTKKQLERYSDWVYQTTRGNDDLATDQITQEPSPDRQTTLLRQPAAGHPYSGHAAITSGRKETVPKDSPSARKRIRQLLMTNI